jgi:hypothetical protein
VADQLEELVQRLSAAHGDNLKSIVLYGSAAAPEPVNEGRPKRILIVLDRITPDELKAAHSVAEWWREIGNPIPVFFSSEEVADSSDVFPIEFIDMSRVRRLLYGKDPFDGLTISSQNLRHQLEYELRAKLLRLRRLYIPASRNANQLARLMAESLDNFAVLFRHVLSIRGKQAPLDKHECVLALSKDLALDQTVFQRIFDYATDEQVWLEWETNEVFGKYLSHLERVIEAVDH